MPARQQHWVPQCYLKGFAVERKNTRQVQVFDRETGRTFATSTRNVGGERDFNRIELAGHEPDAFESGMGKFESELAPALDRIIQRQSISDQEDRTYLLNLIGLLATRNPRLREISRDFHERVYKRVLSLMTATPERWAAQVKKAAAAGCMSETAIEQYDKIREELATDAYRWELPTERHLVQEVDNLDTVLPHLFGRRWVLAKAPDSSGGFVTSDHPVCLVYSDPPAIKGQVRPIGFGLDRTEVLFPISTRLAVIGAFEIEDGEYYANDDIIAHLNGAFIAYSQRQVYARDLHFTYTFDAQSPPRKASRLITDRNFLRVRSD